MTYKKHSSWFIINREPLRDIQISYFSDDLEIDQKWFDKFVKDKIDEEIAKINLVN